MKGIGRGRGTHEDVAGPFGLHDNAAISAEVALLAPLYGKGFG